MEAATALRSSPLHPRSPAFASPSRAPSACRPDSLAFGSNPRLSIKSWRSISLHKQGWRRTQFVIRASLSSSSSSPIAPLRLESPIGEFLSEILTRHPHLLSAAVDRQLQLLDTDRQSDDNEELKPNPTGTDLVLYKRIAEVKANERQRVLEEILYALVVEKFVKANVSLVPPISRPVGSSGRVDQWPPQEEELERAHSPEAFEMIMNHLALILGQRLGDSKSVAPISKLRVGQVYAASVMYGYFLKRVDQRLQLEKSIRTLPWGSDGEDEGNSRLSSQARKLQSEVSSRSSPGFRQGGFVHGGKPCRLRTYVMSFDTETQQRFATIRSKEAFSIIEKHTEALFGRPEIVIMPKGTIDSSKDEIIKISFAGLRRLILEAVTFGSFLWDVESYVDSRYNFVTS